VSGHIHALVLYVKIVTSLTFLFCDAPWGINVTSTTATMSTAITSCSNERHMFASLSVREKRSPSPASHSPLAAASPRPASPVHTESESAPISSDLSATATANECVSEGQWVVNVLSEGEVPDLEANECKC